MPAKEWMRICFELLELLKAHKKAIRRATVNTFGYIAKAIGLDYTVHEACAYHNVCGYKRHKLTYTVYMYIHIQMA